MLVFHLFKDGRNKSYLSNFMWKSRDLKQEVQHVVIRCLTQIKRKEAYGLFSKQKLSAGFTLLKYSVVYKLWMCETQATKTA